MFLQTPCPDKAPGVAGASYEAKISGHNCNVSRFSIYDFVHWRAEKYWIKRKCARAFGKRSFGNWWAIHLWRKWETGRRNRTYKKDGKYFGRRKGESCRGLRQLRCTVKCNGKAEKQHCFFREASPPKNYSDDFCTRHHSPWHNECSSKVFLNWRYSCGSPQTCLARTWKKILAITSQCENLFKAEKILGVRCTLNDGGKTSFFFRGSCCDAVQPGEDLADHFTCKCADSDLSY